MNLPIVCAAWPRITTLPAEAGTSLQEPSSVSIISYVDTCNAPWPNISNHMADQYYPYLVFNLNTAYQADQYYPYLAFNFNTTNQAIIIITVVTKHELYYQAENRTLY